jgi:hypothetical protein
MPRTTSRDERAGPSGPVFLQQAAAAVDMGMMMKTIEIKVRPVQRYAVTSYTQAGELGVHGFSETYGEFPNEAMAHRVAEAMAAWERQNNPDYEVKA